MMEQRRALTLPFSLTKDNLVSWTAFAGCKLRRNSQQKNGSLTLDCSNISSEMTRRKPLLLLTDVLKTEPGRAYVERMRKGLLSRSSGKREAARRRTPVQSYSETTRVAESRSNGRKSSTPRGRQKTPPQPSKRSNLRRRTQSASDEVDKDAEKVKNNEDSKDEEEDKFAEVVDCGLSVSWEPSEDAASRDKFSPAATKDKRTEPEKDVQHSLRRKRKDSGSQCNGTSTPKRHRRSVLRLTGGDVRDGEGESAAVCPGETFEQAEPESLDCNIVQFTVGGDDQTRVLLHVDAPNLTSGDIIKSPERGSAPSSENTAEAKVSEPIVLSSDDEESGNISRRIQVTHRRVTVGDTVIRGLSSQKAAPRRKEISNLQNIEVLQVVAKDMPRLVTAPSPRDADYSRIEVAFSALHCGGYHGKSNGDIMIEKEKIVIPLQDASEEMEVLLSFDRKELRRYSVWEQYELEEKEFCFVDDEDPYPAAVLLFFVSESTAATVQRDLCQLGFKRNGARKAGKASPFILLTLTCPLEGINGALLRSVLEIECLNSMAQEQRLLSPCVDRFGNLDEFLSPVLSLEESIELMSRTGLDSHLLFMLGVKGDDPVEERGSSHSDGHKSLAAPHEPEVKSRKESQVVELDISPIVEQETSPAIEQETSPALELKPSPALELKPSPTLELKPSPTLELERSPTLELERSPTLELERSPTLELERSPTLELERSPTLELEPSSALELDPSLALELEPSKILEPQPSLALEPDASLALEPDASLALEPDAFPVLEPETSLALEPDAFPVLEPATSLSVELNTSPALEPETAQKEGTNLNPIEDPPCEKEEEEPAPVYTLCHRRNKGSYSVSVCKPDSKWTKYKHLGLTRRLIQFPPPPQKGGITVTMEDLQCLDNGQFLNDVIIDFYLKYLLQNAPASVAERTHIFSSFFYKQLTRRDNASEGSSNEACQRQRRHQRVKTWTRHVDIFNKDFLFVPVNQEAHWYLVVICFPGLDEPEFEDWAGPKSQGEAEEPQSEEARGCESSDDAADRPPSLSRSNTVNTQAENAPEGSTKDFIHCLVNCTELTCQAKTVCKRPCILIMDSLKLSLHERVFKLLRDYLQSEWEVRRGSSREFGPDQMKGSHCKVPLQDNSSDCGLYLLQYVESFLKDPVVHFELPLSLERWFPRQQVRRKRDNIRDLILYLYRLHNLDLRHMKLPSF